MKLVDFKTYNFLIVELGGPGGHSLVKNTGGGAGSIVCGFGFWLGKYILGFFKNINLDSS